MMFQTEVKPVSTTVSFSAPVQSWLQRKCPNCITHSNDSEPDKDKKKLQRRAANEAALSDVPRIVHDVLHTPGEPLDRETRAFMEPRFGHDFSKVRIHTDAKAAESAREVNALAYTVGTNVVFGAMQYAPTTDQGRRLLTHELVHVVQQGGSSRTFRGKFVSGKSCGQCKAGNMNERVTYNGSALHIGKPGDAYELEADSVSETVITNSETHSAKDAVASGLVQRANMPFLQRRLVINPTDVIPLPQGVAGPPTPLTIAVKGLIDDTCPDGHFQVDGATGNVTPQNAQFCQQPPPPPPWLAADVSSTPVGCRCICDVVNNAQTTTIAFRAGGPGTAPRSVPGAGPGQGGVPTSPTVYADPRFQGQYLINGRWVDIPFHLIFAHELCGHALPKMQGTHTPRSGVVPPGGTPDAERQAVDVERQIAAEHNPPLPRRPEDYSGGARQKP